VSKITIFFVFHHLMGCLLIFGGAMEMVFIYSGARFLGCVIFFLVVSHGMWMLLENWMEFCYKGWG
jgi:hypothetical protein